MTLIQLKAARQFGYAFGCVSFMVLLFLALLFKGLPTIEALFFIVFGSFMLGFMGFYLGGIIASPIVIKNTAKRRRKKASSQAVEAGFEKELIPETEGISEEDSEASPFEQLQDFIPENDQNHWEHDWVDTSQSSLSEEITINKTKAFEA